ncbi:MAG: GumC family protein [Paracoccaceae bacterium]
MNSRIAPFETLAARALPVARQADADAVDVRGLMRTLWKARLRIVGAALATGILVFLLTSLMTSTYTAYAKVMLDPRKAQIVTGNQLLADLDASEPVVNGELAVLRSNLLLEAVVGNLDPAFQDRIDPALKPKSLISRVKSTVTSALGGTEETVQLSEAEKAARRTRRLAGTIRSMLKVVGEPSSYVMTIKVQSEDPAVAARIANTVAQTYIDSQLDSRQQAVEQATGWLEERLAVLRSEVEAAEAAVGQFQAESLIMDGGTLDNASQQLANLTGQLIEARAARVEAEARLEQLRQVIDTQGMEAASLIVDTPALQNLRAQALELRQQDAVWARTYDENQERRVAIRQELSDIAIAMRVEVTNVLAQRQSELEIARIREDSLSESIAELQERIVQISQNRLGLRQLEREAAAARSTYEALLTRTTEARTQRQLQQADAKLLEHALVPRKPTSPKTKMLAVLGVFVGGTFMVIWVFFNEMTAQTYRTTRELEQDSDYPVLSSLPLAKWQDARAALADLRADPYSRFAERIRQLRTSILMRHGEEQSQSVMLISSAPGEGKTTTGLALAQMAAMAGKSTIIVDCDLRRPRLQQALGLAMPEDFVDFIDGKAELPDVIYRSEEGGFDVIGARGPRPEAADELASSWLRPLFSELTRVYDLVIVDAPAMLAVSDTMIVSEAVDTRIFLVAADDTPRSAVQDGLTQMAKAGLTITGLVLNKMDARKSPDPYAEGYTYAS